MSANGSAALEQPKQRRRVTRNESRYHSEIRSEAVHQALTEWGKEPSDVALKPVRRKQRRRDDRKHRSEYHPESKHEEPPLPDIARTTAVSPKHNGNGAAPSQRGENKENCASTSAYENIRRQIRSAAEAELAAAAAKQRSNGVGKLPQQVSRASSSSSVSASSDDEVLPAGDDVDGRISRISSSEDGESGAEDVAYVNTRNGSSSAAAASPLASGPQDYANVQVAGKRGKVCATIALIQERLQRPDQKPRHEHFVDDDAELEALAKTVDPNAPKPEGALIMPAFGQYPNEQPPPPLPKSVDEVLQAHNTARPKAVAGMALDNHGKLAATLTYAKLHSRARKVAFLLLSKRMTVSSTTGSGKEKVPLCKPGDRVALVYANTEPLAFVTAFYGCMLAGVVPIAVEIPTTKRDAGIQQFGFLLNTCGVRVALTSDACLKTLSKLSGDPSIRPFGSTPSSSLDRTSTSGSGHSNSPISGASGTQEVAVFRGWPRLHWLLSDQLPKPPRDFALPSLPTDAETAYVECTTDRDGTVKGVCVSRSAMFAHCRAITAAMGYREGDTMVCVLDFKKDVGFWHAVLTGISVGMRIVYVPYSLMKIDPSSWILQAAKLQARVALVKSRDLHWTVASSASGDPKEMDLSTLTAIVVADGANPWSLSSCDQFVTTFESRGLRPDVLCPCAGSPETGTVSLRRPKECGGAGSGRGILSLLALSHSVVRIDQENSLTSLTLQDAGNVLPGGAAIVVKMSGPPKLCKTDEIGEICLHAPSTASSYFGLDGLSAQRFHISPLDPEERSLGPNHYVRSGLIGFLGPVEGLVFVVGTRASLMAVSGRQHGADDIIATVLAVEPSRFVYRGRIAIFSVQVLRDERIVIVAEQKPNVSEDEAFNWMVRVLQAIDSIHQVGVYCLALVAANQLPKTPLDGIHVPETRQRFLQGRLHPVTVLMCPQSCILNLPKPRDPQPLDVGPAAVFVGNIVQGARIAGAQGRPLALLPEEQVQIFDILRQRAQQMPHHELYTLINARGNVGTFTCQQLYKSAERIAALLLEKGRLNPGDHVALIFPPGLDLIAAFYGCQAAGLIPVCIRSPSPHNLQASLVTVRMIVDVSKSVAILSTSSVIKLLTSTEASYRMNSKAWPTILDIEDVPSSSVARKKNAAAPRERLPSDTCFLDFSVSTTGQLAGIVVTARGAVLQCKSLKVACELYPSRNLVLCIDPYCGLGFMLWCLAGVYAGHHSLLIAPQELEHNPAIWLDTVSKYKVRDTFCSYSVMEMSVRELASQVTTLKEKGVNLASLRTCVAVAEERPRVPLCSAFIKLFATLGLNARAVSTSFGCRVNTAICMQGASSSDPTTVYVDSRALRNDRVTLVEKGAPHSVPMMECGKLLPGVKVVIANPETKGQCADSHLGELWVASGHNTSGYFSIFGEDTHLRTDHFSARLMTGDTKTVYARTGYLGFLRQTEAIDADGERHDAVFVVGALDETLLLRGMRYHPVDIEATVIRSHKRIVESAVFTWTHLLVVVAETDAPESEALDLVPAITSAVLEEQHLIVGVVVLVDCNAIPINSRGEKQRMHLRDSFLKDQLDPIYVAYAA